MLVDAQDSVEIAVHQELFQAKALTAFHVRKVQRKLFYAMDSTIAYHACPTDGFHASLHRFQWRIEWHHNSIRGNAKSEGKNLLSHAIQIEVFRDICGQKIEFGLFLPLTVIAMFWQ